MIRNGSQEPAAIKATLEKGMKETDRRTRRGRRLEAFFEPGDVVGIKVVPNGQPFAHSSFEIVLEVIEGSKSAGVKTKDMFVYDRYRGEFMGAGYHKILPAGFAGAGLTAKTATSSRSISPLPNDPIARLRSRCVCLDGSDPLRQTIPRTTVSIAPTWASS